MRITKTKKLLPLAVALFAASCAEHKIKELEAEPRDEREFNNALANEYQDLAKKESRVYSDEIDARHFAVKGIQAAQGMLVLPEDPNNWDVHKRHHPYLFGLRHRLNFALDRGGRYIEPEKGAKAQVAFDCLVEEMEEGPRAYKHQKAEIMTCRKLAMDRIADLESAVFQFGPVRQVHFDYNSHKIEHDGQMTVKQVAERVKLHNDIASIHIIGHTDPTGKRRNNLILSQNRATAVKNALVQAGVSPSLIKMAVGRGELATSRNQAVPDNRVVDVHLIKAGVHARH